MKKIAIFLYLIIILQATNFAQSKEVLYLGVYLKTGIRPALVNFTNFTFNTHIFDSNTGDTMQIINKSISIKDRQIRPNFGFGLEFYYKGFSINSRFDWITESGPLGGFGIDLGFGNYFKITNRITLQPLINYSWSSIKINVGPLTNYGDFLKVDNAYFHSDQVDVRLVLPERLVKGEINIGYNLSDDVIFKVYAGFGEKIESKKNYIEYIGKDKDQKSLTKIRDINTGKNDKTITSNGNKLVESITNQTGMYFGLGIAFFID